MFKLDLSYHRAKVILVVISIEVFDSDKIGKDKSLGWVELDVEVGGVPEGWLQLQGVKTGEILLRASFIPSHTPPINQKVRQQIVQCS